VTAELEPTARQDTAAAARVAELVVAAADLLTGVEREGAAAVEEFTGLLRDTLGVRSVRPTDRRGTDRRGRDRRASAELAIPAQRGSDRRKTERRKGDRRQAQRYEGLPGGLVVELAEAGDREWAGDEQRRRLEAALALIATALGPTGGELPADSAIKHLLRNTRLIIVRLGRESWAPLSEAVTPVLGYPPGLAMQPLSIVDPRDRPAALRAFALAHTGLRKQAVVDLRVRSAAGATVMLETVFVDLTGVPGLRSVVAYGTDVTRHYAARARLREVVMGLGDATLVMDPAGELSLTNGAFRDLFGRPRDGAAARDLVAARCRDPETATHRLAGLSSPRERAIERLRLADGRVLELEARPLSDSGIELGTSWRFRELAAHPAPPRRSGGPAAAAAVSEELRGPLAALLGFTQLLGDKRLGSLNENQRSVVELITRNTGRLQRSLDDLALLESLARGQLSPSFAEVDLPGLVRAAVADRRAAGVEIESEDGGGPPVWGDPDLLRRALDHVLDEVAPSDGAVRTGFRDPRWTIEITGRAAPPAGLGPVIAREVIELHGGAVGTESAPGGRRRVRVELPMTGPR